MTRVLLGVMLALVMASVSATPVAARPLVGDATTGKRTTDSRPRSTGASAGSLRLMAIGDVMLGWEVGKAIRRRGPQAPWAHVKHFLDRADLVVANLECVISARGEPWPGKRIHLRAAGGGPSIAAGVDVVSVANNHALDFGVVGFQDTLGALDAYGVAVAGGGSNLRAAHSPTFVSRNGLRVAFLGYVMPFRNRPSFSTLEWAARDSRPGLAIGTPAAVADDVAAARSLADVVVVTVHGGVEYRSRPTAAQRAFARSAIDAGASLVLGHHPHVLQGYARREGTLIAYSLGNFVFSRFSGASNDSAILDVTLTSAGVASVNWIPVVLEGGLPRPAVGAEIDRIMARLPAL